jgi:DNA invertase Pin-like site-specific DNA recombinase
MFAQFETKLRRQRQLEGIVAAKTRRLQGPQAVDYAAEVLRLRRGEKLGPAAPAAGSASADATPLP